MARPPGHLKTVGRAPRPFQEIREFAALPGLLAQRDYIAFQGGKYWEGEPSQAGFTQWTWDATGRNYGEVTSGGSGLRFGRETLEPLWNFLDDHADGSRPFFVWFAPLLPHHPHDPPKELVAPYMGRGIVRSARLYYANITRLDAAVG